MQEFLLCFEGNQISPNTKQQSADNATNFIAGVKNRRSDLSPQKKAK